jgi:hypothetical protein
MRGGARRGTLWNARMGHGLGYRTNSARAVESACGLLLPNRTLRNRLSLVEGFRVR